LNFYSLPGNQLMPKEVVTPQVVANWFANKRKEMRRRSQRAGNHNNNDGQQQQQMQQPSNMVGYF
jgi:hypothetical protein